MTLFGAGTSITSGGAMPDLMNIWLVLITKLIKLFLSHEAFAVKNLKKRWYLILVYCENAPFIIINWWHYIWQCEENYPYLTSSFTWSVCDKNERWYIFIEDLPLYILKIELFPQLLTTRAFSILNLSIVQNPKTEMQFKYQIL
jgi:hypothetical protein